MFVLDLWLIDGLSFGSAKYILVAMLAKRTRNESTAEALENVIQKHVEELNSTLNNATHLIQQTLQKERENLASLPNVRHCISKRRTITNNIHILEEELYKIEKKHYIENVNVTTQKYIQHFNAQEKQKKMRKKNAVVVESKAATTSTAATAETTATGGKEKDALAEMKAELAIEAPPVSVISDDQVCSACGSNDVKTISSKTILVCGKCGHSTLFLEASISCTTFEENFQVQSFSYLRANHFSDWLAKIQAKESYKVEESVILEVMKGLKEANVAPADVTHKKVLDIMKKKKMKSKAYSHCAQITMRITGVPPPRLTSEQNELAKLIFAGIQQPFAKYAPNDRKIFLSYSYCLYRILELLGAEDLLKTLPLLSGKGKISYQDSIMKKIFKELELEWPGELE